MRVKSIVIVTLLMTACGRMTELPVFDDPQPVEELELDNVPPILVGTYESLVDSGLLIVTAKAIVIKNVFSYNLAITELDSAERINLRDTVYNEGKGSMTVTVAKDSVFQRTVSFDTLFYDSDKYAVKKAN